MSTRVAFEKWFAAEIAADRMYHADEEAAWSGWRASRAAALEAAAKIGDALGAEWDSDAVVTNLNYAAETARRIRAAKQGE